MQKINDNLIIRKTIVISIVVAILFTAGFLLGAVTAEIKKLDTTDVVVTEPVTEATTVPTTQAPVTEVPTTQPPVTEAPTTEAPTTEAPTEPSTEPSTEAPAEETEEYSPLIQFLIDILELCKQMKDALIDLLKTL